MNNDNCITCTTCGRPWAVNNCPRRCSCGAYFSEYKYTLPGCVRNGNPSCTNRAVIASKTVETEKQMLGHKHIAVKPFGFTPRSLHKLVESI